MVCCRLSRGVLPTSTPHRRGSEPHTRAEARLQAGHEGRSGIGCRLGQGKARRRMWAGLALAPAHQALMAWPRLWVDRVAGGRVVFLSRSLAGLVLR